jgi:hypothetical protein
MEIPIFYGVIGEDPKEWTNQVEKHLSKIGIIRKSTNRQKIEIEKNDEC